MVVTDLKKETANASSQAPEQHNGNAEPEQVSVQQAGADGKAELGLAGEHGVGVQEQASGQQGNPSTNVLADQGSAPQPSAVEATQSNGEAGAAPTPNQNGTAEASSNQQTNGNASSAQVAPQSREQLKKERAHGHAGAGAEQPESETETKSSKRMRIRLIPIWLRIIILFLAMVFSLVIGAMVGYGTIGGGNAWDVLKQSTWTHIVDIINKE
ncbi:DNA-directed RNA polymerase subunit beta [Bacillus sp. T3]|uniref:DNA-directed RNA polymerase subunit beta n=1 Tax=Bacillus sp. T3 TaxID=467262 RepID=UPI0029811D48|nr:DNA-directed RNA polymerase subunit beta [Bacillus sp. T3]